MSRWEVSTANNILKTLYEKGISSVLSPPCELFKRLRKDSKALAGEGKFVPVKYTGAGGVSSNFAKAQANQAPANYERFYITSADEYGIGSVAGKWLRQAVKGDGSLVDGLKEAVESTYYSVNRSIAANLYGDGTGSYARIDSTSTVNTATITLSNPSDAIRFEPGMMVQAWDGSSSTPRASGAAVLIVAVDPDSGTITTTAPWDSEISGISPGDHIILEGNLNNVATGLAGWLPTVAPTAGDNFFGVDRSKNPNRLAGVRVDGSGGAIDEVVMTAANRVASYGGRPNLCVINYNDFNDIALVRQSHLQTKDGTNVSQLGFEAFKIIGPRGLIEVIPDTDCPQGIGYLLTTDSWTIGSAGDVPFLDEEDGKMIDRAHDADAYEFRIKAYWNLYCNAPGHNGVIKF